MGVRTTLAIRHLVAIRISLYFHSILPL